MSEETNVITVENLSASFGDQEVLQDVSATVPRGMITVVLGASGSGKTTLLKHLLGLITPQQGTITIFGERLGEVSPDRLDAIRRRLGMLFQAGALLNSISVRENTRVPLEQHTDLPDPIIDRIVMTKLRLVGLEDAADSLPDELSGGMRKRAALARALALDPELLLCDEPSSGLDPPTAQSLDRLLLELRDTLRMTILVISHDITSVRRTADRVLYLHDGRILFSGTMEEAEKSSEPELQNYLAATSPEATDGPSPLDQNE